MARYDEGCTAITNIDFSIPVIKEMMQKNLRKRPLMKWKVMDMTQTKVCPFPAKALPTVVLAVPSACAAFALPFLSDAFGWTGCQKANLRRHELLAARRCNNQHNGSKTRALFVEGAVRQCSLTASLLHAPPQFEDGAFEVIVDKGGLDALMGEDTPGSEEAGAKLLAEVTRLLAPEGAVYLCVTLAQPHVLRESSNWLLPLGPNTLLQKTLLVNLSRMHAFSKDCSTCVEAALLHPTSVNGGEDFRCAWCPGQYL